MGTLYSSGLEEIDYGTWFWIHIYNKSVDRLNAVLLKIDGLLDVDTTGLKDGDLLRWVASEGKWRPVRY